MNSKLINFTATVIIAFILSYFLPWWNIMIAAIITGFFVPLKKTTVFTIPFIAIFLYWTIYAFILSSANDFILAKKIAELLQLNGNAYLLILVTGILGGLASGISGVFGNQLRKVFR